MSPTGTASLSRSEMMLLMQWADGETSGEAKSRAEALIAKNAEARVFVHELGAVADSIRDVEKLAPPAVSVADSVMARIDSERGAVVVSLAAERASRRRTGAIVAAGLAMAASVAFLLRSKPAADEPVATKAPQGVPSATVAAVTPPVAASANAEEPEVRVTGGSGVSVFYLQDTQAAASSVVVWVSEEN